MTKTETAAEKRGMIRHGDLLFVPIGRDLFDSRMDSIFCSQLEAYLIKGDVISEGTATGHHHRVADASKVRMLPESAWFNKGVPYFIDSLDPEGVELLHEEHGQPVSPDGKPVKLGFGPWIIQRARELDLTEGIIRTIVD